MTKGKKHLKDPVVLFATIEKEQHEGLRRLSFQSHRSIADLTREALSIYLEKQLDHVSQEVTAG